VNTAQQVFTDANIQVLLPGDSCRMDYGNKILRIKF